MKEHQMEIRLKEHMDRQGITLEELKKNIRISSRLLDEMYNEGSFNAAMVGIGIIEELMIALNISKISELVPKIR
ncbi:hypothetical protein [Enterococcus faecalis]|uniref:hypothetical protein n=1 Tax=Enterococcus faecalis TaxID=1351 RepID=UPI0034CE001A